MRTIQTVFISALLLGLMGCATAPAKESTAFDCAPKGYESLAGWTVIDYRPGQATRTASGDPVDIAIVALSRPDGATLGLTFAGQELIMVDPAPRDQGVPLLVNARWFTKDNLLKSNPSGACEWRPLLNGETA